MELRDYLQILWGRRWLILLCTAVVAGAALAFSLRMTPIYEGEAVVFVGPRQLERDDAAGALQELNFSQQYIASYAEILKSRPLAQSVVEDVNTNLSAKELADRITTRVVPDTRLVEVSVESTSSTLAAQYANALVETFVEDQEKNFGVSASILEPALEPTEPVRPRTTVNSLIGGVLGIMLGVGLAFLLDQLDTTVKSKEDVARIFAPYPVLAAIPWGPFGKDRSLFIEDSPNSPQAESIRMLRTNIQFYSVDAPVNRVLVTSTFPAEGKSTLAANLAAGLAAAGSKVMLVEADLRRPVMGDYLLDSFQGAGLTDVITGQVTLAQALRPTAIPNLSVLTAGKIPPNPSELLGSARMADLLDQADTMADILVLDTPPALPVTDAAALGPQTDGVVLVVRAGETDWVKAKEVIQNFERLEVRVLGIAVNFIERPSDSSYYYNYSYTTKGKGKKIKKETTTDLDEYVISNAPAPTTSYGRERPSEPTSAHPMTHRTPSGAPTEAQPEQPTSDENLSFKERLRRTSHRG
ncbi:MAG: polysaccharide biosynthesis tyrosine autokinase [Actinobacteria bacterium]|nr:polysaccharide biosynthesis tyrosine autokinase [Actinomycetota bacterium]